MSKKQTLIISLSSLLVTLAGLLMFVLAGPFISLYGIQSNLKKGASEQLEAYIDFPVLQENLKIKIRKQAQSALGFDFSGSHNMLAQFAMQFTNKIVDVAVENAVSPSGISLLLSGEDLNELMSNTNNKINENIEEKNKTISSNKNIFDLYKDSEFRYVSHQEFIFYISSEKPSETQGQLVFIRKGFFWKLSDVTFSQ